MRAFSAAILLLAAAIGNSARAEILIGAAGPMTGKLTWIGEQLQRGTEMAVADINAAGGVLGQQVRLITADDFCDPVQAVAAAQKLVRDGVVFVDRALLLRRFDPGVGSLRGGEHPADLAGLDKSDADRARPRQRVPRHWPRRRAGQVWPGKYLADHWGDKKIAILHDNTTYGKGLADETKKELNKRGMTEAIYKAYAPGKSDYSAEIAALQAADIAVLYVGGYHTEVALMARAARDRGYSVQFVSGDAMATEELGLIAGPAVEGRSLPLSPTRGETPKRRPSLSGSAPRISSRTPTRC